MKPSQVSARLRSIASRIGASMAPSQARVASAMRSVLAGMGNSVSESGEGMTSVYIGINYKSGITSDEAVKRIKSIIESEGYKTGAFEVEQTDVYEPGPHVRYSGWTTGNLEVSQSFFDDHQDGWQGGEDDGSIDAEMDAI